MSLVLAIALFPILALLIVRLVFKHIVPLQEVVELTTERVTAAQEEVTQVDLSSHTVKDLRALAKERGIKGVSQLKKADLIKRLQ
jgi:hypothetical protein